MNSSRGWYATVPWNSPKRANWRKPRTARKSPFSPALAASCVPRSKRSSASPRSFEAGRDCPKASAKTWKPSAAVGNRSSASSTMPCELSLFETASETGSQTGFEAGYTAGIPAGTDTPIETPFGGPEPERAEARHDEVTGLAPGQPEQRILIVEDPREGSGALQHLLRNAGFRVAVDEDGIEGVESFRTWRPDLIWIDLRLPGVSGAEAARRVRSLDWEQPVKLVSLAAPPSCWPENVQLPRGMDDVVHKPYQRREIFHCLGTLLGLRYNYGTNAPKMERGDLLAPEALSVLPERLCGELEEALVLLDVDRVTALIGRVEVSYPALGEVMAILAGKLAYTSMLHAITARKANLVEDRQ